MSRMRLADITEDKIKEIINYYQNHTLASTSRKFSIHGGMLIRLFKKYNISIHNSSESETLKHLEQDNFIDWTREQKQQVAEFYKTNSESITLEKFNIKSYFLMIILNEFNIPLHSQQENIELTTLTHYGAKCYFITHKFHNSGQRKTYYTEEEKAAMRAKAKKTLLERYGDENYNNRQKCKETCLAKYGAENVFQNKEIKEKLAQTKLDRYGDAAYTNRDQAKQTCLEKYGAETFLGSDAGQEAIRNYNQEKYGVDYAFQSSEWQNDPDMIANRVKSMTENKYDNEHYSELYLSIHNDPAAFEKFITGKTLVEAADELGVTRDHVYYMAYTYNLLDKVKYGATARSHYEQEIIDFIGADICENSNRTAIDSMHEIDIYIPSKNIGIEFNGTYWHSSLIKDKNYHINKSKLAEEHGIRLIHIYEYEWTDPVQQEKIKMMLNAAIGRVDNKIYARKCTIRQITNSEAKVLNDKIHLQGHRNAQVTYGLFYNNELVQLMSFSKTKYNRNLTDDNAWEIIRGCPGSNCQVVGGVGKLFKHFVDEYKPNSVFSYCDFNKFDGRSYEALGMKFIGYTGPDMKWLLRNGDVVNRSPAKHAELKSQAVAQIFGAGSKKYLIEFNK